MSKIQEGITNAVLESYDDDRTITTVEGGITQHIFTAIMADKKENSRKSQI